MEGERSEGGGNDGGEGGADAAGEGEAAAAGEDGGERSVLGDGLRRREGATTPETGGGAGHGQRSMVVRLKFLNDTERLAQVEPQDTIGYIKRYGGALHTAAHSPQYSHC